VEIVEIDARGKISLVPVSAQEAAAPAVAPVAEPEPAQV